MRLTEQQRAELERRGYRVGGPDKLCVSGKWFHIYLNRGETLEELREVVEIAAILGITPAGYRLVPEEVARRTVGSVEGLLETYREHRERCREAMEQAADDIERLLWRDNLFLQDQAIKDLEALASALQGKEEEKR